MNSKPYLCLLLTTLTLGLVQPAAAQEFDHSTSPPSTQAARGDLPADQPAERLGPAGHPNPRPLALHQSFIDRGWQAPMGLLFIGDSITERWRNATDVWRTHYWKYTPANFGVAGDRTENVLWRIDNGELDHITPKVVVLLIGTNNINDTVEHIVAADTKIVSLIHARVPNTKVLLLGLLPRAQSPDDSKRLKIAPVNAGLAKLDDGKATRYLDVGPLLLEKDGTLSAEMMADFLHPTPKAYGIIADRMQPLVDEMMRD